MTHLSNHATMRQQPGEVAMAFDWRSFMDGRLQDREIREYLDGLDDRVTDLDSRVTFLEGTSVNHAYGGMRYRTATPIINTIGTTPEQITLYDEEMPLFGTPVNVSFDEITDELVIDADQGGIYDLALYINFQGEQGEVYTLAIYADTGSGPAPIGDPLLIRVSQADPYAEVQLSTQGRINGEWRFSIWVNADAANTTFTVFATSLQISRMSLRLEDQ